MGQSLITAWTDFGRRAAVIAGMCVALFSLIYECPVWVASLRGAGTIVVIALLVHWIARLLAWSYAGDRDELRAQLVASNQRELQKKGPPMGTGGQRG